MIKLTELQSKEIISTEDGKRLGTVFDLEINPRTGKVTALVLLDRETGALFKKSDEIVIPWSQIITIGEDIILITGN